MSSTDRHRARPALAATALLVVLAAEATAQTAMDRPPIAVAVETLQAAPQLDGDLSDWPDITWYGIPLEAARAEDQATLGEPFTLRLAVAVYQDRIFLAARWPDPTEDRDYKPWRWFGAKYRRGRERDDMLAVRFDFGGDFDACMLAEADYRVDVWTWSAGRSDPAGLADDGWHQISTRPIADAAEHEGPRGRTVYIRKHRDEGERPYRYPRPERNRFQGERLPGVDWSEPGRGSAVDVRAAGRWAQGYWSVELARRLDTGHADDVRLDEVAQIRAQLAAFDHRSGDDKQVSPVLQLQLPWGGNR